MATAYNALRSIQQQITFAPLRDQQAIAVEARKIRRIARTPIGRAAVQLVHLELLAATEDVDVVS